LYYRRRCWSKTDDIGQEIEERPAQIGKIHVPKNNNIITRNDHVVGTQMNEKESQRSSPLQFKD
jgi:hypothetical protein